MLTSSSINVDKLRTVFFWPLVLEFNDDLSASRRWDRHKSASTILNEQFETLKSDRTPWQPVTDTLRHLRDQDCSEDAYSEYIYFHDFLQKTLFGSRSDPSDNHPLMLLRRTDVEALGVCFRHGGTNTRLTANVERLNLYLLRPGIAVMVLQVATDSEQDLATLMRFNDIMRRSHLPYFDDRGPSDHRPQCVSFKLTDGKTKPFHTDDDIGFVRPSPQSSDEAMNAGCEGVGNDPAIKAENIAKKLCAMRPDQRKLLPYQHWRWLLTGGDEEAFPFSAPFPRKACWRHFSDERLPILTTFVLKSRSDYYRLTEGDWYRLAFVDPPGSDPTPYAADFLRRTFHEHVYDRYHHLADVTADAPVRYLMCDYGMTAVTHRVKDPNNGGSPGDGEESDYSKVIEMHMQRHYYQMYLLAVVDKSVMLNISSRISHAVEVYDSARSSRETEASAEDRLMEDMEEINRDFLHYVHRFRFTGISGQLQPSEMYAQLRAIMKLDVLFDDIRTELDTAVNFLSGRSEKRGAEAAERLGIIATIALVIGLVMAFYSMNILTGSELLISEGSSVAEKKAQGFRHLATGIGVTSFIAWVAVTFMAIIRTGSFLETRFYPRVTQILLLSMGILGLLLRLGGS